MKYGVWNVSNPDVTAVNALTKSGFSPLTAMILSARGMNDAGAVQKHLSCDFPLPDPYQMTDMDRAAGRVGLALTRGEKIAVFGDYDVDGITATCLLTEFLQGLGADCISYIPGRIEEGYGLNPIAIRQLHGEGVKLIVTVDCGITAVEEAELCKQLGIDLVITDHHECKEQLPNAIAVVDPHRPDCRYPHRNLSGVGVAFKLAAALAGDQEVILRDYADLVCLGTVADVMPLIGENRVIVSRGLESIRCTRRPGLVALMKESSCNPENVSATSIGYMLAPRINAAGRMEQIELALELFLTDSESRATQLARALCDLNRQRQQVESQIYEEAVAMLPSGQIPEAIVLADEGWHQGVVGIVASRMAEAYCCPTFLICLDGDHGKASSRSFGGFNLFTSLNTLSDLLESYGGHELAAGFTIHRQNIGDFRREICRLAGEFYTDAGPRTVLDVDCIVTPELLTVRGVDALSALEPCGNGCPKPVLMMRNLIVDRISMVASGKHMRLRLRDGNHFVNGIFFSSNPESASIEPGDLVDVAFQPQINDFRGERSVQLHILDIRPSCGFECSPEFGGYHHISAGTLTPAEAAHLLPDRATLGAIWRYLASLDRTIKESPLCLCRKIVRWANRPLSLGQMLTCLDIFRDVGLLRYHRQQKHLHIELNTNAPKTDLTLSQTMQTLLQAKES